MAWSGEIVPAARLYGPGATKAMGTFARLVAIVVGLRRVQPSSAGGSAVVFTIDARRPHGFFKVRP
jgi:hypothetical protein